MLDSNVLISALLVKDCVPQRAVEAAAARGRILISTELMNELGSVLARPKFGAFVTPAERDEFLAALVRDGEIVEVKEGVVAVRDPKDDHILALALAGRAAIIVSGDRDLLVLHPFRGVEILSPSNFLARIQSAGGSRG